MQRVDANEVARVFGVSANAVCRWRRRYDLSTVREHRLGAGANWVLTYDLDEVRAKVVTKADRRRQRLVDLALDLEDLAHQTHRGDVDAATWARVCSRLVCDDVTRALNTWRAAIRGIGVPMTLVDDWGEPYRVTNTGNEALMRFDWPAVLRWTRRVLDH